MFFIRHVASGYRYDCWKTVLLLSIGLRHTQSLCALNIGKISVALASNPLCAKFQGVCQRDLTTRKLHINRYVVLLNLWVVFQRNQSFGHMRLICCSSFSVWEGARMWLVRTGVTKPCQCQTCRCQTVCQLHVFHCVLNILIFIQTVPGASKLSKSTIAINVII